MIGWLAAAALPALAEPLPPPPPPPTDARPLDPEDDAAAQLLFANGRRLYAEGKYGEAALAFSESYRLSGRPEMLFNLANAYERAGDLDRAIDALTRYRVFAPAAEVPDLVTRTGVLQTALDAKRAAEARAAEEARAEAEARAAAAALPPPLPDHPIRRSPAPWVVAAIGAGVGAGGGAVAAVTWSSSRDLLAATDPGDAEAWARLRPVNNAAIGAAIGGGAVGVVGTIWAFAR